MEIWKDIKGYEGLYQISNYGNARSLDRVVKGVNNKYQNIKGCLLKQNIGTTGYYYIVPSKVGLKKRKSLKIHQLVAISFLDYCPDGTQKKVVDHIDGNPLNNNLNNLRVVSQRENVNSGKTQQNTTSKYRGVSWSKSSNKWHSRIYIDGKKKHLGYFKIEYEAHLAYQKQLKQLF